MIYVLLAKYYAVFQGKPSGHAAGNGAGKRATGAAHAYVKAGRLEAHWHVAAPQQDID